MFEGWEWLCFLVSVPILVTLGHFIWVLIAKLFGGKKSAPRLEAITPADEILRTQAQITRLLQLRLIDTATHRQVSDALHQLRQGAKPPPLPVLPLAAHPPVPHTHVEVSFLGDLDRPKTERNAEAEAIGDPKAIAVPETIHEPVPDAAHRPPALPPRIAIPPQPFRPTAPPAPKRPAGEVFSAFLRTSNIRWGELIGGFLIIGCSIALVVSFWNQIAGKPFFQFGIFTGVTTAMLSLGLYAEHRWKLPTTSRGILLIATLLVPLNFLGFAALSHGQSASLPITVAEIAALGLFGYLVFVAARTVAPFWPGLFASGVFGSSAALLIARHVGPAGSLPGLFVLGAMPIGAYGIPIAALLQRASRWRQIRGPIGDAILLMLGVLAFAAALSLGFVVFQGDEPWTTAHRLAPLLSLAAAPSLATGLLLWRKITARRLGRVRTAGTAIGIGSAFLMLGAIALAWPDPAGMLPLALADFIALTAIAILFELPYVLVLAAPCLLLAWLLGIQLAFGHIGWSADAQHTLHALTDPANGPGLLPLALIVSAGAGFLTRRRDSDARICAGVAAAFAVVSIGLVSQDFGRIGDPHGATFIYLVVAIAAISTLKWVHKSYVAWAGCILLLAAFVQFFLTRTGAALPVPTALIAYATFATGGALIIRRAKAGFDGLLKPAQWTAKSASAFGAVLLFSYLSYSTADAIAWRLAWVCALWIVIAIWEASVGVFYAAQIILALATTLGIVGNLARQQWFFSDPQPLLEPWTLQAVGIGLALLSALYSIAETVVPKRFVVFDWLAKPWSIGRVLALMLATELATTVWSGIVQTFGIEFSTNGARPSPETWSLHATGGGAWAFWGALLLIFVWRTLRQRDQLSLLILIAIASIACPLYAAQWATAGASASALRWSLAVFLIACSIKLSLRHKLPKPIGPLLSDPKVADEVRLLFAAIAAIPIVALSMYPAVMTLAGSHLAGPVPGCFFGTIGDSLSYVVPLLIVAAAFSGNAIQQRSARWAVSASAVCNLTITLGYALAVVTARRPFDDPHIIRLIQLNILAIALFALAWQVVRAIGARAVRPAGQPSALHYGEIGVAIAGNLLLIAPAAIRLLVSPDSGSLLIAAVGESLGWLTLLSTLAAVIWVSNIRRHRLFAHWIGSAALVVAIMFALTAGQWNQANWLSFHVLMVSVLSGTAAVLAAGFWIDQQFRETAQPVGKEVGSSAFARPEAMTGPPESGTPNVGEAPPTAKLNYEHRGIGPPPLPAAEVHLAGKRLRPAFGGWSAGLSGLGLFLALRAIVGDPGAPWWSVGTIATLSLVWTGLACWLANPRLLYVGGPLLNLAATILFLSYPWTFSSRPGRDLLCINVAILAVFGLATFILHFNVFAKSSRFRGVFGIPFHRAAAFMATVGVIVMALIAMDDALSSATRTGSALLNWAAVSAALPLAIALFWEEDAPLVAQQLYGLGLAAVICLFGSLNLSGELFEASVAISLSSYVLLTGTLRGYRQDICSAIGRIGLPRPQCRDSARWIVPTDFSLALIAIALAVACDFTLSHLLARVGVATFALIQVLGLGLAIRITPSPSDSYPREVSPLAYRLMPICIAALGSVVWAWAFMSHYNVDRLDRSVVAMVALAVTTLICVVAVNRLLPRESLWSSAIQRSLRPLAAVTGAVLLLILLIEIDEQSTFGFVPMMPWGIVVVLLTLLTAATLVIFFAIRPERDPLQLAEERRGAYVYAAEALLALTFLHLRLTVPWLFGGLLTQYWPMIVMILAFGGVGLSEFLARRNRLALGTPLFRTGIFLPLLPIIGIWLAPSMSTIDPSLQLFTVGLFYAIISATRRSFVIGLAAALTANGGLWWIFYHRPGLGFLTHPQIWVVPTAISVLIAAQLNRDRLSSPQLRFIRYCCLMLAYVSSTSDIFLNGVSDHPWLPFVLAILSVAGVMTGIFLRLRAFLFLGTAFLGLAIVTMIYYASANLHWTWLWYVAGIALGGTIIVIFALFEKKRAEMLAMVEGLKGWE